MAYRENEEPLVGEVQISSLTLSCQRELTEAVQSAFIAAVSYRFIFPWKYDMTLIGLFVSCAHGTMGHVLTALLMLG